MQIRRFADWLGAANLRICESAFSREKRRFADLQIGWGLQICKSAFSRGNADSQICRLIGWGYKSANLRIGDLRRGVLGRGGGGGGTIYIYIYIYQYIYIHIHRVLRV